MTDLEASAMTVADRRTTTIFWEERCGGGWGSNDIRSVRPAGGLC